MSTDPSQPRTGLAQFWAEMKRRHVVRFALGYAAAAFVVLQLAEIVIPAFGLGEEWLRLLVIATAVAFPPALLLAWVFDVTPTGLRRTEALPEGRPVSPLLPRLALMGATFVVVGGLAFWLAGSVNEGATAPGDRATPGPLDLAAFEPGQPVRSLAVLPLSNQTEGADGQDYFTAGMQEELITQLSQIPGLRVASRTSTARYATATATMPDIGRELGVDAVIEGSVRRAGNQVRVSVALYHAASETSLWSGSFDRELEDLFALQSEVALEIARAVQGQVDAEDASLLQRTARRDVDPDAADAYLRGRYEAEKGTPEGYRAAVDHFQTAFEEDSTFAPALTGLAGSRFLLTMALPEMPGAEVEQAWRDAQKALAMDSTSWEAREVLSYIERAAPRAATAVHAARPPDPSASAVVSAGASGRDVTVIHVPGMGDSLVMDLSDVDVGWTTAVSRMGQRIEEQVRRAQMVRGEGVDVRLNVGRQLMAGGRFSDAADVLEDVALEHPDRAEAWELWSRAEASGGDLDAAADVLEEWSDEGVAGAPTASEVSAIADAAARDDARPYWRWLQERLEARRANGREGVLSDLATTHAALGQNDAALEALVEALRRGERSALAVQNDPAWDRLRDDPRFLDLVRRTRAVRMGHPGPRPPG